jgi:hypothetical protein
MRAQLLYRVIFCFQAKVFQLDLQAFPLQSNRFREFHKKEPRLDDQVNLRQYDEQVDNV